jgi:carbon-monoxide dehydrogenase medium subunit
MGEIPLRAEATERALASGASTIEAAQLAAENTSPSSDLRASAEYRQHLARVLVLDALTESAARS